MRTIYSDVILSFGKYKGKEVAEVLLNDAGYFYWLQCAGAASLAPDVAEVVAAWCDLNPSEAKKVKHSAEKKKRDDADKPEWKSPVSSAVAAATRSVTPELPTPPKVENANWGCW